MPNHMHWCTVTRSEGFSIYLLEGGSVSQQLCKDRIQKSKLFFCRIPSRFWSGHLNTPCLGWNVRNKLSSAQGDFWKLIKICIANRAKRFKLLKVLLFSICLLLPWYLLNNQCRVLLFHVMHSGTPDLLWGAGGRWWMKLLSLRPAFVQKRLHESQKRINGDVGSHINTAEESILSWFQLEICVKLVVGSLAATPRFLKHQLFFCSIYCSTSHCCGNLKIENISSLP